MISSLLKGRGVPFIFFITTILAYGLLLTQTGFYWDDWPFVWIAKFLGPADFFPAFANIRPFLAPIFFITTSLLPPEPIYWQIFMLVIRFVSGLLAWFIFSRVWPKHRQAALAASFLFLVFPGYSQHWVAFTHINQEWVAFLFYLFSLGLTARALRNPQRFKTNTVLALLFLVLGVFPTEYFVSLEPLRFLFIWVVVSEETKQISQRFQKTLKIWLPYMVIWLINIAWLAYFFFVASFGSYDVEVVSKPLSFIEIARAVGEAIWKAGFYVWAQVLILVSEAITAPSSILMFLLIGASAVFLYFYLKRFEGSNDHRVTPAVSMLAIGLAGILLGRLPSFAADLPLTLQSSNDRFMISMMIGGSLFITGLVELIVRNQSLKTFLFAVLIAIGIGQQFYNANIFRRDWLKQQDFYWQLAWRIPEMKPGTLLITDQLPVDYETDLSFSAPINWIYAPEYTRSTVPYGLIYTEKRLGGSLRSLQPGEDVKVYLRTAHFDGSTAQAIVIHMPKNGCLRVLGSEWDDEVTYGGQSVFLTEAIPLSDPDLINVDSENIPALPFLSEPEHGWCYYYTKAELARQRQDWEQVNDLFAEAASLGYQAGDPFEWLVFIEGQAMSGDIQAATELSRQTFRSEQRTRKGLCQLWKRVQEADPALGGDKTRVDEIMEDFQCAP
ncbi:MAG TPA: hypothetical protein VJ785_14975 [Anaerolineales bacterium]|nr:hypothetical protein [Anaerolineales bacterium]